MKTELYIIFLITTFISLYFAIFWFLALFDKKEWKSKKPKEWPMVSIAVPAFNEEKNIEKTIISLLELQYPKEKMELIVVDDGSKDRTFEIAELVKKKHPEFIINIIKKENGGKGTALNTALGMAKGDFFVCMDADSFIDNDALLKMIPYFADERVAVVLPCLKVRSPQNFLQKLQWFEYLVNMYYKWIMSKLECIHVAPGPFSVYKTKVLRKIGGFDENNLTEDLEICLRIQKNDYKIIQLLEPDVTTIPPKTIQHLYKQRNRWYKGAIMNSIKHKDLLFNKAYGDFGIIQMPMVVLSGVLTLAVIFVLSYDLFSQSFDFLRQLSLINFDILTLIKNIKLNFHILDMSGLNTILMINMFVLSFFILKKAHNFTKEKLKHGIIPLVSYVFLYYIILGVMWVGISFEMLLGKKQKW